jgi:hypothetical protein
MKSSIRLGNNVNGLKKNGSSQQPRSSSLSLSLFSPFPPSFFYPPHLTVTPSIVGINQPGKHTKHIRQTHDSNCTPTIIHNPHPMCLGRLQLRQRVSKCRLCIHIQHWVLVLFGIEGRKVQNQGKKKQQPEN